MGRDLTHSDLFEHAGEPRVRDLVLANSLGMSDPHAVRRIIARNRAELEQHGEVSDAASETSPSGGRPGRSYLLNEAQALLVCMFARTPAAAAVRRQVIEVFTAYRRGDLGPRSQTQRELKDRIARLEASLAAQGDTSDASYALRLADTIANHEGDGMHLGPTDLRVLMVHLRGARRPKALPPAVDADRLVHETIAGAGPQGIRRTVLSKRLSSRATRDDIDRAIGTLLRERQIRISHSQNPRGGPRITTYRSR